MSQIPEKFGFYWAKWRIADDGTPEGEELTPSDRWEPVELWENCLCPGNPEYRKVSVPGVAVSQDPQNFVWGPEIRPPGA